MRVGVLGAGIMGASTARALAERGHDVTLFEQFGLGHTRGSSHGRSRIIRRAYPDAFYTAIMAEAYPLWHELQSISSERIVFESGLLYFGASDSANVQAVVESLELLSVPHTVLDSVGVAGEFPELRLRKDEVGVFTPEAGWVNAEGALSSTIDRIRVLGGVVRDGVRFDPEDFDRYVLCPGPWIRDWVPDLEVTVTEQVFGYFRSPMPISGPVWIEDCPAFFYGFPSEPGSDGFKIGYHTGGNQVDPAERDRFPDWGWQAEALEEQAMKRFGASPDGVQYHTCLYTSTPDEDFRWGRHGDRGYWVSPCSGHGFKFGPWIGRKMADFVEEKDAPERDTRFFR